MGLSIGFPIRFADRNMPDRGGAIVFANVFGGGFAPNRRRLLGARHCDAGTNWIVSHSKKRSERQRGGRETKEKKQDKKGIEDADRSRRGHCRATCLVTEGPCLISFGQGGFSSHSPISQPCQARCRALGAPSRRPR